MDSRRSSISSYSTDVVSYIQIRILGKGAHGRAVLYRNASDNSLVVWKEILIERNTANDVQQEIDILSMLDHPNIVSYYNHFVSFDTIFIEMEYANGGSLSKYLKEKRSDLSDSEIRWIFFQLIFGIEYIHKCQIIHRDIKTLNIFMTTSTLIKIGDFGISKVLLENEMAQTRVGTPVYMSPEVVQGYLYSTKSDIWSCGCVLYELISRTKLVKCSNELGIAMKIVNRDFQKVPNSADEQLKNLLNKLLEQNPSDRPTASEILKYNVWNEQPENMIKKVYQFQLSNSSPRPCSGDHRERSVVSLKTEVFVWGGGKKSPIKLEEFSQNECALQVSAGLSHFAVLTVERNVYTWSTNQGDSQLIGYLGHGKSIYKIPHIVSSLKGINIKEVSCGAESTTCLSCNGEVFTCGSNYYGQLGLGSRTPANVNIFTEIKVTVKNGSQVLPVRSISSGHYHVAAIAGEEDHLFSWGCGEFGRLGLGHENDTFTPTLVELPVSKSKLKLVKCGPDNSFIVLKYNDRLMACGNNKYNKLGINVIAKGLLGSSQKEFTHDVPFEIKFKLVRFLRDIRVATISCGKLHTAILDEYDKLFVFGQNKYGQLGLGDTNSHPGINDASKIFSGKRIERISCGDNYCIATTFDNEIFAWGYADNGRLGFETISKLKFILRPRPVFGCLYKCADLKSCGWQSIMITERVLESNTIAASASNSQISEIVNDTNQSLNTLSSNLSPWLRDELHNADFIPINISYHNIQSSTVNNNENYTKTSDLAPWLQAELNDTANIPIMALMNNENNNQASSCLKFNRYTCDCGCKKCIEYIQELEERIYIMETKR